MWVATNGSDSTCARGNSAAPCLTLNRAYQIALQGDTVEVRAGTYGSQTMLPDSSKTSSTDVTFVLAAGASVTMGHWNIGANHVTLDGSAGTWNVGGFEIRNATSTSIHVTDVTLRSVRFSGQSQVLNASFVTLTNLDIGNTCSGDDALRFNDPVGTGGDANDPHDVVVEDSLIHGLCRGVGPDDHPDCVAMSAGRNVTFRRNRIWDCGSHQGLYLISELGGNIHDVLIENNMFGDCNTTTDPETDPCSNSLILDVKSPGLANITVRYNSFAVNTVGGGMRVSGSPVVASNIRVYANAGEGPGCDNPGGAVIYAFNVWDDADCSTTDTQANPGFVSNASGPGFDLHIGPTSPARGHGDPANVPADDFDRQARPNGAPDAGADEIG